MKFYSLWDKGRDAAPPVVGAVFDRWERMVGAENVHIVEEAELAVHMDALGVGHLDLTIQTRSDLLRTHLLLEHGGAWFDATVMPMAGVAEWAETTITSAPFFAFRRPRDQVMLSSRFLVARPGAYLLKAWLRNMQVYWDRNRYRPSRGYVKWGHRKWGKRAQNDPVWSVTPGQGAESSFCRYLSTHYIFEYTVRTDPRAAAQWDAMRKLSAHPPHLIQRVREVATDAEFVDLLPDLLDKSAVHKLCWRKVWPQKFLAEI